jgi:hypothetical protein
MMPTYFPAHPNAIELSMKNSTFTDVGDSYWLIEEENLHAHFQQQIARLMQGGDPIKHFSIFALAPQPLLVKLGVLLCDLYPAQVYQLHREPSTWGWVDEGVAVDHLISEPGQIADTVALNLSLSATINNQRIIDVLGDQTSIWTITHAYPNNDYIRNKSNLADFRTKVRSALNKIKSQHGQNTKIHVFPAMPVSAAVELGRVWMPKADLPLVLYDQNNKKGGFYQTLTIEH